MKAKELREKTAEEVKTTLHALQKDRMNLRFSKSAGTLEKTSEVKKLRRDIARAKTIIAEKKRSK